MCVINCIVHHAHAVALLTQCMQHVKPTQGGSRVTETQCASRRERPPLPMRDRGHDGTGRYRICMVAYSLVQYLCDASGISAVIPSSRFDLGRVSTVGNPEMQCLLGATVWSSVGVQGHESFSFPSALGLWGLRELDHTSSKY